MNFFELIGTAFKNLFQRKARTLLTILGVIIGTMSITLMVAIGIGSQQQFIESISKSEDLTKITVNVSYSSKPDESAVLNDQAVLNFEALSHVRAVLPIKSIPIYLKSQKYFAEIYAQAVPLDKLQALFGDKMEWGSVSYSAQMVDIAIGADAASWSFYLRKPGKSIWECPQATDIDFTTEKFDVYFGSYYIYEGEESYLPAGVVPPNKKKGQISAFFTRTGSEVDYQAYIDINFVTELVRKNKKFAEAIGLNEKYESIYVYADDMNHVEDMMQQIKDMGYEVYSPLEWINQMKEESARQQAVWGAVGAIALLVSAIGIINTMLTSIMERKREIGIMKVLGCSLVKINGMFLIEAAVIGFLGGVTGVGLSYLVAMLVKLDPTLFGGTLRFVITPLLGFLAVAGSAAIGMMAGIYPATRAMRMSPLEALRNE